MNRHGFLEVETPMMNAIPGGATARPLPSSSTALVDSPTTQHSSG